MSMDLLTMVKETTGMFMFLGLELTALFLLISFAVGVLQEFIPPTKIQAILSSKKGKGYFSAAALGAITPFCSCSTIPFLKGLLRARAGFGPMMVFLFTSPLLNPVIIVLFLATFGGKLTITYMVPALFVSVFAGYVLEKLGFERFIKKEVHDATPSGSCTSACGTQKNVENRWVRIARESWKSFINVLPYLLLGIAIGSLIYGFMPTDFVARVAGQDNLFAIPVSAIIGLPLYIRAETVIPLSSALLAKGMAPGAVIALIIGSSGASLTEVILLKSMFKSQMIAAFLVVVTGMAIVAGTLFSLLF